VAPLLAHGTALLQGNEDPHVPPAERAREDRE
jgi:hypothetical protein